MVSGECGCGTQFPSAELIGVATKPKHPVVGNAGSTVKRPSRQLTLSRLLLQLPSLRSRGQGVGGTGRVRGALRCPCNSLPLRLAALAQGSVEMTQSFGGTWIGIVEWRAREMDLVGFQDGYAVLGEGY